MSLYLCLNIIGMVMCNAGVILTVHGYSKVKNVSFLQDIGSEDWVKKEKTTARATMIIGSVMLSLGILIFIALALIGESK